MNKSVTSHDASVLEEPVSDFDFYAMLGDEAAHRRVSRRDTEFPQTTTGKIGWRIGRPGSNLEMFKRHARGLSDIYKTLKWPPGCS